MMMLLQVGLRAAPHARARRERAGARSSGSSGCSASSKREVALEEFLEVPAALGPLLVVHSQLWREEGPWSSNRPPVRRENRVEGPAEQLGGVTCEAGLLGHGLEVEGPVHHVHPELPRARPRGDAVARPVPVEVGGDEGLGGHVQEVDLVEERLSGKGILLAVEPAALDLALPRCGGLVGHLLCERDGRELLLRAWAAVGHSVGVGFDPLLRVLDVLVVWRHNVLDGAERVDSSLGLFAEVDGGVHPQRPIAEPDHSHLASDVNAVPHKGPFGRPQIFANGCKHQPSDVGPCLWHQRPLLSERRDLFHCVSRHEPLHRLHRRTC
mmetsp:Transcript_64252/g.151256  ORF Transcript_64252/g.151256 Transcript_64252/m.151256 type:complete len:325 (+) Transcript_64252:270-1244(+)